MLPLASWCPLNLNDLTIMVYRARIRFPSGYVSPGNGGLLSCCARALRGRAYTAIGGVAPKRTVNGATTMHGGTART